MESRLSRALFIFLVSDTTRPWPPRNCRPAAREAMPVELGFRDLSKWVGGVVWLVGSFDRNYRL